MDSFIFWKLRRVSAGLTSRRAGSCSDLTCGASGRGWKSLTEERGGRLEQAQEAGAGGRSRPKAGGDSERDQG